MKFWSKLLSLAALAVLPVAGAVIGSAFAGEAAVDGVNGKISGFGGGLAADGDKKGLGGVVGSLTFPLSHSFGMQLDGALASVDGDGFRAGGAHLFWRDPSIGMLGLFGSHSFLNAQGGVEINRAAIEGQAFFGPLTLDGALGYRFGDVKEEAYGKLNLDYYLNDDWLVSGGFSYDDQAFATFKSEYQFASDAGSGFSLFTQGQVHDRDNYSVLGGFKIYFGSKDRSLIDRHRREDPDVDFYSDVRLAQKRVKEIKASKVGLPICTVNGDVIISRVISPSNGACLCPAGTTQAGQPPFLNSGNYLCFSGSL